MHEPVVLGCNLGEVPGSVQGVWMGVMWFGYFLDFVMLALWCGS